MVETKTELPVVEEPKVVEAPKVDIDGLVSELERAGISNTEELSGKLRAGSEAGRLAQLLGDERKHRTELEQRLKDLETRPAPKQDFMDYPEGQTIDIETAIAQGVNKVLDKREAMARQAQEKSIAAWNRIQSDEDYHLIKDVWEEKLKDPGFVFKIQSGQVDPVNEYTSTLRGFYKTLLKKSHETITTMKGGKLEPPHVETGGRTPLNIVSEDKEKPSEARKYLDEMHKKVAKGYVPNDEEEANIAEASMIVSLIGQSSPR